MTTDGTKSALSKSHNDVTPRILVKRCWRLVAAVCTAHISNPADAEDAMQQTFLKAITKLPTLRDKSRLASWVVRIARRTCLDYRRRRRNTQTLPDEMPAPISHTNVEVERVRAAVDRLPSRYREVITLYYMDGLTCSAVAQALRISEGALRKRIFRARSMLHRFFKENRR